MILGTDLLGRRLPSLVEELACDRLFVLIDPALRQLQAERITALQAELPPSTAYYSLECSGEESKGTSQLAELWSWLAEAGASRQSLLVIIGGGALLDLGGFAAATYMRGIRTINVPTTLLSMVDASVGGKTAIDFAGVKNLVGAFHSASRVVCDLAALDTLGARDLAAGMAEVVKCGFIADPEILDLIEANPNAVRDSQSAVMRELIERSVRVKAEVVSEDLRESGRREILNYGHTLAHAIERNERYQWRHGAAVSVGMVYAAELALATGHADEELVARTRRILESLGLPTSYKADAWPSCSKQCAATRRHAATCCASSFLTVWLARASTRCRTTRSCT